MHGSRNGYLKNGYLLVGTFLSRLVVLSPFERLTTASTPLCVFAFVATLYRCWTNTCSLTELRLAASKHG